MQFLVYYSQGRINWTRGPGQSLDREAPKRLAELRSVSHALVSTLQKHRSKTSKLIENLKLAAKFRLINLIVALTFHLPSWHRHCTRTRFTVVVSCNDEIAVRSCPRLCLQRQVAELASAVIPNLILTMYPFSIPTDEHIPLKFLMKGKLIEISKST